MRVNVVCGEIKDGWIYGRFCRELKAYAKKYNIPLMFNEKDSSKYDVVHFIPYYDYDSGLAKGKISSAWFSHREEIRKGLQRKFDEVAEKVDLVFSHSKQYADFVIERNIKDKEHVHQIIPGVGEEFKKKTPNKEFVVGYVGRTYTSTNRKNTPLVKDILTECKKRDIKCQSTGGKKKFSDIPKFYTSSSIIISPAKIEGGPMSLLEAIKCGVPFLCFRGVGMADEFEDDYPGVIKVDGEKEFMEKIMKFDMGKYNKKSMIDKISRHKFIRSWENFASDHFRLWKANK